MRPKSLFSNIGLYKDLGASVEIIDFSEYRSEQQRIRQEVDPVYQAILSSCTNPEYVSKCLQDMDLIDQTENLLLKFKVLREKGVE